MIIILGTTSRGNGGQILNVILPHITSSDGVMPQLHFLFRYMADGHELWSQAKRCFLCQRRDGRC